MNKMIRTLNRLTKTLYILIGLISLSLGVVGIILPLLPTTPFLLLSAFCFARSSQKLYLWLHTNRMFGENLRRYKDKEGIPFELKIGVLSVLWITLSCSALFAVPADRWYLRIFLIFVGVGVTIHILLIKTYVKSEEPETTCNEQFD